MMSKARLAIRLSRLLVFNSPNIREEQYPTDSEIAAEAIWAAYMNKDIEGNLVADLGAGTGILGIAALELGAKKVLFVERDRDAIGILKSNLDGYDKSRYSTICSDISEFKKEVDTVIMNPPFGTREKHADREFLLKAFSSSKSIYSFHKNSTSAFIGRISAANGFQLTQKKDFKFPLKQAYSFHRSRIRRIDVSLFVLKKA
ncbi:methyltransferase [Candidatus Woesearchaeota archaeon]|nr:methyltransferase [Candidatus Woesearchaeota archaeon]